MIDGLDGMLWVINRFHVAMFCFEEVRRCNSTGSSFDVRQKPAADGVEAVSPLVESNAARSMVSLQFGF